MKKLKATDIPGWMLVDSFRYALGRRTYQVNETVNWFILHWDGIDENVQMLISKELNAALILDDRQRRGNGRRKNACLGDMCDREDWERLASVVNDTITDGFGNVWGAKCPDCGGKMVVVRPGKVQCSKCG